MRSEQEKGINDKEKREYRDKDSGAKQVITTATMKAH
jgi:hypothetical protein